MFTNDIILKERNTINDDKYKLNIQLYNTIMFHSFYFYHKIIRLILNFECKPLMGVLLKRARVEKKRPGKWKTARGKKKITSFYVYIHVSLTSPNYLLDEYFAILNKNEFIKDNDGVHICIYC